MHYRLVGNSLTLPPRVVDLSLLSFFLLSVAHFSSTGRLVCLYAFSCACSLTVDVMKDWDHPP